MAWILGYIGLRHDAHEARLARSMVSGAHVTAQGQGLFVAAGGPDFSLKFRVIDQEDAAETGWIVAGLGMRIRDARMTVLDESEWNERLANATPRVEDLDGHFCGVRWSQGRLVAFNDAVGLRTLYLTRKGGGVLFSTRQDWLVQCTSSHVFDFETLGAQWLGRAEFAPRTAFVGIERLGQGGRAEVSSDGFTVTSQPFDLTQGPQVDYRTAIAAVANPSFPGLRGSLACSGGLDSRLLLAAGLQDAEEFRLHNYGPEDHPDVIVVQQLGRETGCRITILDASPPASFDEVQALATRVHGYAPASTASDWGHYAQLREAGLVGLDGSFGEIGRCWFYRNLRSGAGREALLRRNVPVLAAFQRHERPGVFGPAARATLEKGHILAIEAVVSGLPHDIPIGTQADLLMLRLEGPRHAGFSASHIDDLAAGYFPFTQASVVRSLLRLSPEERFHGRLYRSLVGQWAPGLARIPLVRNGRFVTTCPFRLSGRSAGAWSRMQRFLGRAWLDDRPAKFLDLHEAQIRDLVASRHCRDFEAYDHPALVRLVDGFYDGRRHLAAAVDRWLAFELWRLGSLGVRV